jgi:hypothetical protein
VKKNSQTSWVHVQMKCFLIFSIAKIRKKKKKKKKKKTDLCKNLKFSTKNIKEEEDMFSIISCYSQIWKILPMVDHHLGYNTKFKQFP